MLHKKDKFIKVEHIKILESSITWIKAFNKICGYFAFAIIRYIAIVQGQ